MKVTVLTLSVMLWLTIPAVVSATAGDIAAEIEQQIRDHLLDSDQDYLISIKRCTAPPRVGYDSLLVEPLANTKPRGTYPVKVSFFLEGKLTKSANLAVHVGIMQPVLVVQERLSARTPLTADLFEIIDADITEVRGTPVAVDAVLDDLCASRTIRAGEVLTGRLLKRRQLVQRGDFVQIQYVSGSLQITAVGEAKQPGARGDYIKVMSLSSNRIIMAEVQDEQTVRVAQ